MSRSLWPLGSPDSPEKRARRRAEHEREVARAHAPKISGRARRMVDRVFRTYAEYLDGQGWKRHMDASLTLCRYVQAVGGDAESIVQHRLQALHDGDGARRLEREMVADITAIEQICTLERLPF